MKKIVFTALLLIAGTMFVSAQVKLSFNPEKGKTYVCRQEMSQNTVTSVMGQDFEMQTVLL